MSIKKDVNELRKVFSSEPNLRRRRNELIRSLAAQGMTYEEIAALSPEPMSTARIQQIAPFDEDLVASPEVAEALGVSDSTVRNYEKRGLLPSVQFAGRVRFRRSDLERIRQIVVREES